MFNFERNKSDSNRPDIVKDYKVILFDDGPILYIGKNNENANIIGASIDEDCDIKFEYFFHVVVNDDIFAKFMSGKISLREIMHSNKELYVLEKSFDSKIHIFHSINFDSLPKEYLPTENSFLTHLVSEGNS